MARINMPEVANTSRLSALAATAEVECVLALDEDFAPSIGSHALGISLHNSGIESTDLFLGAVTLVEEIK